MAQGGLRKVEALNPLWVDFKAMEQSANDETLRGIKLMAAGELDGALDCFERAIALREELPWRVQPRTAWGLAAALINRGDVLRRLAEPQPLAALQSYQRAIEVLEAVPLDGNPAFPERLLLAWINLATTEGELHRLDVALRSFEVADALFADWRTEFRPERVLLQSMLCVNRSRVLMDLGRFEAACDESDRGVKVLAPLEPGGGLIAEAGIRSRAMRCRALASWLDRPGHRDFGEDWIAAATDEVEEAIGIVRRSGVELGLAADLVRYGARIYRACQPQFLAEFILNALAEGSPLASDQALCGEMDAVILLARQDAEQRLLIAPHVDEIAAREMRILRSLER